MFSIYLRREEDGESSEKVTKLGMGYRICAAVDTEEII